VITDLPFDEVMPSIDANLIRVPAGISISDLSDVVSDAVSKYDSERQLKFSADCIEFYDYRSVTRRLAEDIEIMKRSY
jgi:hypothetical protein